MSACQGCGIQTPSSLVCPTCTQLGRSSFFCTQDCFHKNWGVHQKLHAILKQQAKLQAELERKPEPSIPSVSHLREKMYRPPQDEETGTRRDSNYGGDKEVRSHPITSSSSSQKKDASPAPSKEYGSISAGARLLYAVIRNAQVRRLASLGDRRKYVMIIGGLIILTMFVHFHLSYTGEPVHVAVEAEAKIIEADVDPVANAPSIGDLQRQISSLKDQQAKHDQQIAYIMSRFVEKTAEKIDPVTEQQGLLPQDLVAKGNREASIAIPTISGAGPAIQGRDHGAEVHAENPSNGSVRSREQPVVGGDMNDQHI